jgi:uncharacterized protein (TIGR02145 family)
LKPKERNILANEARATDLAKAVITDNSWDKLPYFCPIGWHVPSDTEWITLFDYAGGLNVAGGKLKETGTTHWNSPNTGATDEYGFKYLPGGLRDTYGSMYSLGVVGDYWGDDSQSGGYEYSIGIFYNENSVGTTYYGFKDEGISVRCLKN